MRSISRCCLRGLCRNSRPPQPVQSVIIRRWESTIPARQWSTPLAKGLAEAITTTGPISVAAYMRQCLTSSDGGYYTSLQAQDRDQFGKKGDFVTSPEISQVFGELVGIWIVAEWMAQGRSRDGVYLMELGPGRGTLMDDILRTVRNFKDMASSIESIYLVESSPQLRATQHALLCGKTPLEQDDSGHKSFSRHLPDVPVIWAEDLRMLPQEPTKTPFIVAHEFFDALPIHIFQSVPGSQTKSSIARSMADKQPPANGRAAPPSSSFARAEWRELVVTPTAPFARTSQEKSSPDADLSPDFELSISNQSTPHSMLLPHSSPRYNALLPTTGSTIEISPESLSIIANLAGRIGGGNSPPPSPSRRSPAPHTLLHKPKPSGAALILDYGPSTTIPANSLRGIRSHMRVSPFSSPGLVDISADVDFLGLAEAAINASPGVLVHGPVEQGVWLRAMGIQERAAELEKGAKTEERRKGLGSAWRRLVDRGPNGMGKTYKVMAILPCANGEDGKGMMRRPVGFGGEVKL